jgi:pimeloyl-ACP methyl ester carboxylesterase
MLELRQALDGSPHHYTTEAVDFTGDTSLEGMVEHVRARIGAGPTTLVGFSMGSWIAQAAAAGTETGIDSLILLSSWTHAPQSYLDTVRNLHQKVEQGMTFADLRSGVVDGFVDPDHAEVFADRWVAMAGRVGRETFLAETSAILAHPHVEAEVGQINVPTLAVCAAQDRLIEPKAQTEGARMIQGARFMTIPNSGHHLAWEQPAASNDVVLGWLDNQLS